MAAISVEIIGRVECVKPAYYYLPNNDRFGKLLVKTTVHFRLDRVDPMMIILVSECSQDRFILSNQLSNNNRDFFMVV